jgi:hypothetical protein
MSELPKLKVTWYSRNPEGELTCNFEEAKDIVFGHGLDVLVFIEGRMVNSYEDLSRLVAQNHFQNKETLHVVLVSVVAGG